MPYREFMMVRVFDSWMHEQDMRRALGRPGHLTGPVVDASLERFRAALGFIVGKKAAAPQGAAGVIATTGDNEQVVDGRATLVADPPPSPTVRIVLPFETFIALGGGRWNLEDALGAGGAELSGDEELGRRVLANMAFTP